MNRITLDFLNWNPDQFAQLSDSGLIECRNVIHTEYGWIHARAPTGGALSHSSILSANTTPAIRVKTIGAFQATGTSQADFAVGLIETPTVTTASLQIGAHCSNFEIVGTTASMPTMASQGGCWIQSFSAAELDQSCVMSVVGQVALAGGGFTTYSLGGTLTYSLLSVTDKPRLNAPVFTGAGTTNMPDASCLGTIGQFVFAGIFGTALEDPYKVQWCAIGDATDWPTPGTTDARTKQAGQQVFPAKYGKVTGIAEDDFSGYIFQQRAIHKATYVGGDVQFNFDTIYDDVGCVDYNRLTRADGVVYFESEKGYHSIANDQLTNIGFGRIDNSYTPNADIDAEDCSVVVKNSAEKIIYFQNQKVMYNYATDQWSFINDYPDFAAFYDSYNKGDQIRAVTSLESLKVSGYGDYAMGAGQFKTAWFITSLYEPNKEGRTYVDSARINRSGGTGSSIQSSLVYFTDEVTTNYAEASSAAGTAENARTQKIHYRNATAPVGRYVAVSALMDYTQTSATESAIRGADIWFMEVSRD